MEFTNQAYPIVHLPFENCPDVFSFNFGDYQGQFFMGNDGKIKVVCDKPLRVDVSQMNGQYDLIDYQNSTISITTDKGDVYTFGGEFNTVDINFPYGVVNTSTITLDGKNATITAWHLKQIKTHNGNIINFEYTPQDRIDDFPSPANRYDISPSVDYGYEKLYLHEEISFYHSDNLDEPGPPAHQVFHSFIKKTYLSKITGPAGSVEFTYSHQLHPFYTAGDYVINLNVPNKLDRLTIKDPKGITVKTINLNYNDFGSPTVGYREMLTSVQTIGGQDTATYSMDYYRTSEFPDPLTKGIDIWGFYNGRNQNTALVPASTNGYPYYTVDWSSPNNYRLADTNYCNVGLLHHIVYPTKGTTEFVYEGNSYSKILRKTVAGGTVPETFVENGYAGGARIKKIIDSTGVREFKYLNNFQLNATGLNSSGIAYQPDVYYYDLTQQPGNIESVYVSDENVGASSAYDVPSIGYAEVTEISEANGYTKYYYTTRITNPDKYTLGDTDYAYAAPPDMSTSNYTQQIKRSMWPSSCELERGKLTQVASYDQSNHLLRKTITQFNLNPNRFDSSVVGFICPSPPGFMGLYQIYQSFGLYYFNTQPVYSQTIVYNGAQVLAAGSRYSYKANQLLSLVTDTTSKGQIINTSFSYPSDYTGAPYDSMVRRNMLSGVIEKNITNNGNPIKYSKTTYYRSSANLYLPQSVDEKNGSFSLERKTNYLAYDAYGHLQELSNRDSVHEVYLWGYAHEYPVARVVGSTYSTVSGLINQLILDSAARFSDAQLRIELNKVRTGLHDAQVWTYTYAPLVGITSTTDPEGNLLYYDYDGLGRLTLIRDKDNRIIKRYCYDYSGQSTACKVAVFNSDTATAPVIVYNNVQLNTTFVRNNCGTGTSGSSVVYTVPAGQYNSLVSQADADQKAQQDANANGQDYANDHGACVVPVVSLNAENDHGIAVTVQLSSAGTNYTFTVDPHGDYTLDNLPQGTYNITLTPAGPGWYNYSVGCGYYDEEPGTVTFYSVDITPSCNFIDIF